MRVTPKPSFYVLAVIVAAFAAFYVVTEEAQSNRHRQTSKVCVKTSATFDEKLQCGQASSPAACWEWVRRARCVEWGWDYSEFDGHHWAHWPCSKGTEEQQALCKKHGWDPAKMPGGSREYRPPL